MGKKFLETYESRKKFVLWVSIAVSALILTAVLLLAFSDGKGLTNDDLSSSAWWIVSAKVIAVIALALVSLAVIAVVGGLSMYFLFADSFYPGTLRSLVSWYDKFIITLDKRIFPAIGRLLSWPFHKSSRAVQRWIDSGS